MLRNKSAGKLALGRERKENSTCLKCTVVVEWDKPAESDLLGDSSSDRVSARQRQRDELASVSNAKFGINPVQMRFDGAFAQAEPHGDHFVRMTIANQICNLLLAVG